MMEAIVVLAIIVVIVQMGLSIYQVRYYDKFVRQLVHKYSNTAGYTLNTDTASSMFKKAIVVLVTDQSKNIIEAHVLSGNTIFSKFKALDHLTNVSVTESLINEIESGKMSLTDQALIKNFKKI